MLTLTSDLLVAGLATANKTLINLASTLSPTTGHSDVFEGQRVLSELAAAKVPLHTLARGCARAHAHTRNPSPRPPYRLLVVAYICPLPPRQRNVPNQSTQALSDTFRNL